MSVRTYLTTKLVTEAYRRLLDLTPDLPVSMNDLADYLAIQGVKHPRTGKVPTRQGVHYALKHSPEGQKLLKENAKRG